MPIDFSRLRTTNTADSVLQPREIFRALPNKARQYQFPRDVQAEVWSRWFEHRERRDQVLKMNTGSGKTVVGLLLLKSCLNEGFGPAVYVVPTRYLAEQVAREAAALGIAVGTELDSLSIRSGRAILITTIKTLFNGQSRFGVDPEGPRLEIGSIVIDDAHACLQEVEEQFTITIPPGHSAYTPLFNLFRDGLRQQSPTRLQELEALEPNAIALVPFWSWHEKLSHVIRVLHEERQSDELKFAWPLLKEVLAECRCVFSSAGIEISPPMIPADVIPSFARAQRRIFMSATFSDDSVLISHFGVDPAALNHPLVPDSANDIGDRMILVPQALNPNISSDDLKQYLAQKSAEVNVVVLVPSHHRANYWHDVTAQRLTADNIAEGVQRLRAGHVGLTVLVNKYDGIDLPDDACRILVVDGLPDVRRAVDRVEQSMRHGAGPLRTEAVHRIEQGMGRANRSADDYSVVLLMGSSLVRRLYQTGARQKFTAATRTQLELSEQVAEQLAGATLADLNEAIDQCLKRNPDWVRASRGALVGLEYPTAGHADPLTTARRKAFDSARIGDHALAIKHAQTAVDLAPDDNAKGWVLAELAAYQHRLDPVQAQVILRSAKRLNASVTTPLDGISYQRLSASVSDQAGRCQDVLRNQFQDGNELLVAVNGLLEDLRFQPDTAQHFEKALAELGRLLGFETQCPESQYGRGPDVLWKMGDLQFAVIEAKNGATTDQISKSDCNQLAGSINWFYEEYDRSCCCIPVLIHPAHLSADEASAPTAARVVQAEKLESLKEAFRSFATSAASKPNFGTHDEIAHLLTQRGLTAASLFDRYSVTMR